MHSFILFHFHAFGQKVGYILAILQEFTDDGGTDGGQFGLRKEQDGFYAASLRLMSAMVSSYSKSCTVRMPRIMNPPALAGKINGKVVVCLDLDARLVGIKFANHLYALLGGEPGFLLSFTPMPMMISSIKVRARFTTE